jgi:hypothetical protein
MCFSFDLTDALRGTHRKTSATTPFPHIASRRARAV